MTRINVVPPEELCNKHLMAEYRELPRVFTAVRKHIAAGKQPNDLDIPEAYVLGKGHVTFFYNKCAWLEGRYIRLGWELLDRGFDINLGMFNDVLDAAEAEITPEWYGGYKPTENAIALNRARIAERLKVMGG